MLSAQNAEAERNRENEEEDSDEESEEEDEEESESDSDDGLGGSMRAGPSRVSFASPPAQDAQTGLKPGDIDKFGNVVQEPEMTKREAKRAAKAKEAAKAQQDKKAEGSGSDESESEDEDPLLQAGSGNKTLNKQMKMSSLGETAKKPAASAPQPMNRKERSVCTLKLSHIMLIP